MQKRKGRISARARDPQQTFDPASSRANFVLTEEAQPKTLLRRQPIAGPLDLDYGQFVRRRVPNNEIRQSTASISIVFHCKQKEKLLVCATKKFLFLQNAVKISASTSTLQHDMKRCNCINFLSVDRRTYASALASICSKSANTSQLISVLCT